MKTLIGMQLASLITVKAALSFELRNVEDSKDSYNLDESYTSEAYDKKVALERAIEGAEMSIANLNTLVPDQE